MKIAGYILLAWSVFCLAVFIQGISTSTLGLYQVACETALSTVLTMLGAVSALAWALRKAMP